MNLENNKHLKEVEKILNNWDMNKGYLTTNDIHGVDLVAEISIADLGLDIEDEDEIAKLLEQHYDDSDYYFRREKDGYMEFALVASSCEEIFITFEGDLCFPDENTKSVKLSREDREIEIIAYSLEWMHDNGCFPSIYQLDYYSNSPTLYNFYETNEYKELHLSDDDKIQAEQVQDLVGIIEFKRYLEENTQTLGELPHRFYEALPELLQTNDGYIEVLSVDSFDVYTMSIEFETDDLEDDELDEFTGLLKKGIITEGSNDLTYKITISLLPNSVRFMKGLDDVLGLTIKEAV